MTTDPWAAANDRHSFERPCTEWADMAGTVMSHGHGLPFVRFPLPNVRIMRSIDTE